MEPALLISGMFVVAGVFLWFFSPTGVARAARMKRTRRSTIAEAFASRPAGALVELEAKIVEGPAGTFEAPLSGRACVWCRLRSEVWTQGRNAGYRVERLAIDAVPFLLDDGSGVRARVSPEGAIVPDIQRGGKVAAELPRAVEAVLIERAIEDPAGPTYTSGLHGLGFEGAPASQWMPGSAERRFVEERLEPGDTIYVLGPAKAPAASVDAPYREEPREKLLELARGKSADEELVFAKDSEARISIGLRYTRDLAVVFLVIGALIGAGWLLWR